ncbi:GNAT family N-acetyltransferase [Pseudotenacibaculum sp. MALMAid0570]|uniref:GNAT family N-acetyltransferase n=1 Tax=Pseudotenacibaculum sp. MALMAid0570 TaxID=3143938 RepID=UPI0032DE30F2
MLHIREVTIEDASILALLGRVTYTESHGHFIESKTHLLNYLDEAFSIQKIKKDIQNSDIYYLLVTYNDLPVGYTKIVFNVSTKELDSNSICRLEKIYLLDDFIDKKIGIQLFNKTIEKTKELQFEKIWLTVYIKNQRAINFYKKNNFKIIGNTDFYVDGVPYENIILAKNLTL